MTSVDYGYLSDLSVVEPLVPLMISPKYITELQNLVPLLLCSQTGVSPCQLQLSLCMSTMLCIKDYRGMDMMLHPFKMSSLNGGLNQQHQVLAFLSLGIEPQYPLHRRLSRLQEQSGNARGRTEAIKSHPARIQSLYCLRYPNLNQIRAIKGKYTNTNNFFPEIHVNLLCFVLLEEVSYILFVCLLTIDSSLWICFSFFNVLIHSINCLNVCRNILVSNNIQWLPKQEWKIV